MLGEGLCCWSTFLVDNTSPMSNRSNFKANFNMKKVKKFELENTKQTPFDSQFQY